MSRRDFLIKWASRIDGGSSSGLSLDDLDKIRQVKNGITAAGRDAAAGAANKLTKSLSNVAPDEDLETKAKTIIEALNNGDLRLAKTDLGTLAALGAGVGGVSGMAAADPEDKLKMTARGAGAGAGLAAGAKIGEGLGQKYLSDRKNGDLIGMLVGGGVGALGGSSLARSLFG